MQRLLSVAALIGTLAALSAWAQPADRSGQNGVTIYKQDKCWDGYRLYSSRNTNEAHLIAPSGEEVHAWKYADSGPWHYAEMLPNGHLVAIWKGKMILELDWNSKLVWKFETSAHHDFARTEGGNTLVVSGRRFRYPKIDAKRDIYYDIIVEVTPEGEVVWEWKSEEHADEIAALVDLMMPMHESFRDWPHINTCEILPHSPTAERDARFRKGNILFCGRHIDTIGVIDRESGKVIWAWGPGELLGPHMPTMLPNGHILVYDNGQNSSRGVRGYTRVLELDPLKNKIVWEYKADPPESFYSPSRGSSNRLPNGNTLIAESDSGRLFEITPDGEVVWEFLTPDFTRGKRQALYRVVPYSRGAVNALLSKHATK
ncbi:MAG: aryl-sulfate sulfotransferase [Armatimonadetes bacterium]|nr:aryl-sulfate sulfotransferase [Armatimonadota bacterium]